jgi:translation initiation factor IF-1
VENTGERAEIESLLPRTQFTVRLGSGELLTAFLSRTVAGCRRDPRLQPGTVVTVERSPYDPAVCRIVAVEK